MTIPRTELESLQRRCASLERQLAATERRQQVASPSTSPRADTANGSSLGAESHRTLRPSGIDGRMLADEAGISRYLGETSGATFLDSLKELIAIVTPLARVLGGGSAEDAAGAAFLGSLGQYQTHDSRPMVLPQAVDPLALPPEADIAAALSQVRYFIQDGNGSFPSGGVMFWPFEDVQSIISLASLPGVQGPGGHTRPGPHHRALALYHTAFAVAHLLQLRDAGSAVEGHLGEDHFARARSLLGNLLDRTTYTVSDIAVLALTALYFVENNRRDAGYMAISNAMTISVMHGLHKGGSGNEVGVRTFWTVYVIDRYACPCQVLIVRVLTVLDGWAASWAGLQRFLMTPLRFRSLENARTSSRPLTNTHVLTIFYFRGLPSAAGLRAHVELCRISDYLVYSSYRESGLPDLLTKATVRVAKALDMLGRWRESLPATLQLPADPLTLVPVDLFTQATSLREGPAALLTGAANFGHDRACWSLHMSYNQVSPSACF